MPKREPPLKTEPNDDLDRLRREYARREQRLADSDIYSSFNPAHNFTLQGRGRETLALLRAAGYASLDDARILELGCGAGGVLLELLAYGTSVERLHGVDLLPERVSAARKTLPHLPLAVADGRRLPYPTGAFDLVLAFTVFTSILDERVKQAMAHDLLRVVSKPRGTILWYDYWLNPTNRQTRGVAPAEIRDLFPGCTYTFRRITLAPPIARRLVPISQSAASLLEKLKLLNSHYLVAIRPNT